MSQLKAGMTIAAAGLLAFSASVVLIALYKIIA